MFNLNQFRNKLVNGGARASQFEMRIFWPTQHVPQGVAAAADVPFLCTASEFPGSKIGEIAVNYFGRKLYVAGDREFDPLTVTILNDENFRIRGALEEWIKAISGESTTVSQFSGGITADSYVADAEVRQYSRNNRGATLQTIRFVGLFPVHVNPIKLSWATQDEIETYDVQFRYQWWEHVEGVDRTVTPTT